MSVADNEDSLCCFERIEKEMTGFMAPKSLVTSPSSVFAVITFYSIKNLVF